MALSDPERESLISYATSNLPGGIEWHTDQFAFISDEPLRARIGQEFLAARFLYKLWEGLRMTDPWARQAQVQLQIQQYASIYEACLHHLLFVEAADEVAVKQLLQYETLVERQLPGHIMDRIHKLPEDDVQQIKGAVLGSKRTTDSKVRFEAKADAAVVLGIIDDDLAAELKAFYTTRNYIHLHAELRQTDVDWEVNFSRDAYRRIQPFTVQANRWVEGRKP